MAEFRRGDMWTAYDEADLFLITTNSTIHNGALVMGRGVARQARNRFPGLDEALGRQILNTCEHLGQYGLLVSSRWPAAKLGAFQVKTHYDKPASLALIQHSTAALQAWCAAHPTAQVCLNFPGIHGNRCCLSSNSCRPMSPFGNIRKRSHRPRNSNPGGYRGKDQIGCPTPRMSKPWRQRPIGSSPCPNCL